MKAQRTILISGEDVECIVDYIISSDGIGAYEFWGHKGFDGGESYIEVEDIQPCVPNRAIEKYIDDNFGTLSERVAVEMDEDAEDYYDDEYGQEPDAWDGGFADNH